MEVPKPQRSGETLRSRRTSAVVSVVALGVGLAFALTSPVDKLQGEYSRIIHVHVPTAWLAFLAFGITALGSILYLIRRTDRWDRMAASSAEIGVLFTGLALVTGMIWGDVIWGRAWDWGDARLTTTLLMFFVYLGYLALRRAIDDPEVRARRSAILGAIAVVQVPLVYFSVNLFRTLHQVQSISPGGID
ncbi:MAG: cytochrome C biogenesis protein, partial [Acidimicrobiia bacterium]|nr:cytochrome C biogenesis protein [Acidimicrobiia bacterium]